MGLVGRMKTYERRSRDGDMHIRQKFAWFPIRIRDHKIWWEPYFEVWESDWFVLGGRCRGQFVDENEAQAFVFYEFVFAHPGSFDPARKIFGIKDVELTPVYKMADIYQRELKRRNYVGAKELRADMMKLLNDELVPNREV